MKKMLGLILALTPLAPAYADTPHALSESERRSETPRPVAVTVPQDGIGTSIDIGRVASDSAGGGGLLGALIISSMDNKAEVMATNARDRAESAIAPLTEALADFPIDTLALDTTRMTLAGTDWVMPGEVALVPGADYLTPQDLLATHPADETVLVNYSYQTSPDFTQLQVFADVILARSEDLEPLAHQRVISLVRLNERSYEEHENVARWAADDGALAKQALVAAFARLEKILPVVLALDEDGHDAATDKKRESAFTGGFHGPVLLRDEKGPVIWSKKIGFIASQSAGD